jgi:hypothetical protein
MIVTGARYLVFSGRPPTRVRATQPSPEERHDANAGSVT